MFTLKSMLFSGICLSTILSYGGESPDIIFQDNLNSKECLKLFKSAGKAEIIIDSGENVLKTSDSTLVLDNLKLPAGETVQFSVMVKGECIFRNDQEKHWTGPKFELYTEVNGKATWIGGAIKTGTFDWETVSFKFEVPIDKALNGNLSLGLVDAKGQIYFKHLTIKLIK